MLAVVAVVQTVEVQVLVLVVLVAVALEEQQLKGTVMPLLELLIQVVVVVVIHRKQLLEILALAVQAL
jgi:hypothetical protein